MAKVTYASLKLKTNTNVNTINFNGNQIEVLQYLPIEEKYSLVNITLAQAKDEDIFNPIKKDMYFYLNLVFMYSNISFTEKQREDYSKLYDCLQSSGLLNLIIENIPDEEFNFLYSYLNELEKKYTEYKATIGGFITDLLKDIPEQIKNLQKIMDKFDPNKFNELIAFSKFFTFCTSSKNKYIFLFLTILLFT